MTPTVLIVDDSLTVRMDLADAFQAAGFRVLPCATVADAREALARETVDFAILDVLLPDGDGVELLQEIREGRDGEGVPVLMLSTEAEVKDRIRGLQTGADEYIGKPYDTGYVVARAGEFLRRKNESPGGGSGILVIDDSVTFRETLREHLEEAGYTVLTAGSGEEGLRLAATHRPAAIVVDGVLPGVDGATVVRRVRLDAALRAIPCVLLTASEDRNAELRALDAGADAFLRKDEHVAVVLAKLAAVLRGASSESIPDQTVSLLGPKKILAVDDSATYLHAIAEGLRVDGYDVILARSGEEALELLAVQSVDCILLDLLMPGIGGEETCLRIKAVPVVRDIPLIMLTALEDREAMIRGLGAGADDYIPKSSEFEILRARVRAQIRRKQFEDENRRFREELLRKEREAAEARAARQLAETRAVLVEELERKNRELEAFSYSVSHDLRAPLRSIDGFSQALIEDSGHLLDETGMAHLKRVRAAAQRMGELIDDMLELSRVGRAAMKRDRVDLARLARDVVREMQRFDPERRVEVVVRPELPVHADERLMRIVLTNLIGNAWKFTSKAQGARIEVGVDETNGNPEYFIRDNGAGFDMQYVDKLFRPFQRLHNDSDFPGTGIGLATVHRIVDRHGGRIRVQSKVGQGTIFYFTIPTGRMEAIE